MLAGKDGGRGPGSLKNSHSGSLLPIWAPGVSKVEGDSGETTLGAGSSSLVYKHKRGISVLQFPWPSEKAAQGRHSEGDFLDAKVFKFLRPLLLLLRE